MKFSQVLFSSLAVAQSLFGGMATDNAKVMVEGVSAGWVSPAKGTKDLGPAASSKAWFAVTDQGDKLVWTLTPFSTTAGAREATGEIERQGVWKWIAWSMAINDAGVAAITAGAHDAAGGIENGIVVVETAKGTTSWIRVGKFMPHWVQVDGKNRIWVIGTEMASIREEEPGDLPMVRVYSREGVELARGLTRSQTGEAKAGRAMNMAFTGLLSDDYLVQVRGHREMHRIRLDEKSKRLEVTTIVGPEGLGGKTARVTGAIECGHKVGMQWVTDSRDVSLVRHEAGRWIAFEVAREGKVGQAPRLVGCTANGEAIGVAAGGELIEFAIP